MIVLTVFFFCPNPRGGGVYSTNFYTGRLHPEVQPLALFRYIFSQKRYPFHIPSIDKLMVPLSHTSFRTLHPFELL